MKTRNAARRAGGRRVPSRRAPGEGRDAGFRFSKLSVAVALIFTVPGWVAANPVGGRVVAGSAAIGAPDASTVEITQGSHRAIIEWNGFSIAAGETTRFIQPSATAVTLNRVTGGDPSRILGNLQANGIVYLINGNGILFGQGAKIDVAGLVASTADIRNDDFMAGRMAFTRPGHAAAAVVNQGDITVAEGGLVALVAPGVENAGRIQAKLGRVLLASGDRFAIDFNGDGLISFAVEATGADSRG
ncbi:MAG: filamentous hemagglutinin N-terminal domain-containing protein, partial [Burkholderiales bacterium]|nr:filamentous hemagglutinin N-terminal domain-containing protein [Burkholderiales bacterium]